MKHVLISCDACGKTVPDKSVRDWWGLVNPKSDLPTFSFAPLTPKTIDKFSGHVCGAECLRKTLEVLAASVEPEKVAAAGKKSVSFQTMNDVMNAMLGFSKPSWMIEGDKKMLEESADDDEEEY